MSDIRQKIFRVPDNIALSVGLSWDFIGSDPVDLDLSAVSFTQEGVLLDVVFFNHLFPAGTDEDALRAQYTVETDDLPYMFLSGDSTIGGEEENQLSGIALANRRRHYQMAGRGRRNRTTAAVNIFNRLYDEDELRDVQKAANADPDSGAVRFDENGIPIPGGSGGRELCDEVLTFVMSKIPEETGVIFLSVTSYTGVDFTVLPHAKLVIFNESTNERVGTIDLKTTTGTGTANLGCMLVRVPPQALAPAGEMVDTSGYWDLRELNISTYGYTFVDVLPLMFRALGVPSHSQMDAVQHIPNYSLVKSRTNDRNLSDVRFGIGWDGEHDLDAFMVFLDEANNYVDHIYPKDNRLRSIVHAHMAQHSGDALSGSQTAGDEEFIDLIAYRVPANVRTIVVGATFVESFGADKDADSKSIFDVPNFYMRLQNRSLENPYSSEVDRWDVFKTAESGDSSAAEEDAEEGAGGKKGRKKKSKKTKVTKTYRADDDSTQPIRSVMLGALIKRDRVPLESLLPGGRRLDQQEFREESYASSRRRGSVGNNSYVSATDIGPESMVTLFEFVPIHQHIPIDPRMGFSRVIPYVQGLGSFLWGSRLPTSADREDTENIYEGPSSATTAAAAAAAASAASARGAAPMDYTLNHASNMVGWKPTTSAAVGGRAALVRDPYNNLWEQKNENSGLSERYGVELRFLEILSLQPQMPDKFKCHAEAWVFGSASIMTEGHAYHASSNRPFKSPYLLSRDNLRWDGNNKASYATFVVHQYDRIRVMVFEHSSLGFTDIDLLDLTELWEKEKDKDKDGRFNKLELTIDLAGGSPLYQCTIKLQICRISLKKAMSKQKSEVVRRAKRIHSNKEEQQKRADERLNKGYNPCQFM